ncbi:helix-turn-helix domain-containing protein [Arenimonas sp. MALMAid1274]|uniref:helix-turn-helix domain-containing protein n=1 Tax=Arenimonas sp. MALMAid1274 TaxID=3411630 RepID=UPI003B9F30A9
MLVNGSRATPVSSECHLQTPAERIRRARTLASMSQRALAEAVGVKRSAVAQWERRDGCYPSMPHLVAIAVATNVHLEWLGTGRGPVTMAAESWEAAVRATEFAHDDLEASCLDMLRRMPFHVRKQVAGVIELIARSF